MRIIILYLGIKTRPFCQKCQLKLAFTAVGLTSRLLAVVRRFHSTEPSANVWAAHEVGIGKFSAGASRVVLVIGCDNLILFWSR